MYSFANAQSTEFVGFDNYVNLLASQNFRSTLFNTFLWILIVPAVAIVLGLLIATLADKMGPRGEKLSKTLIFLPLAIGGVSAGAIGGSSTRPTRRTRTRSACSTASSPASAERR